MDNATRILTVLDRHLDHRVRLILYGRAALVLGYETAPAGASRSLDVDAILPLSELRQWEADAGFWAAQQAANAELEADGLYLTHIFAEDQVVLRPDWLAHLVPLTRPALQWLQLFRPATLDLVLTKMMRGEDGEDLADAGFLIRHDRIARADLQKAISLARIPDVPELRAGFDLARARILALAR